MKQKKISYQFVVVFNPKTEENQKEAVWQKLEGWSKAAAAELIKKDNIGSKDLIYAMKGVKKGDFWTLDVESMKPLDLKEINLFLNRENNVIRYLILRK